MIYPWLNGAFWTLSRKRGVPADTIKGVLFFKFSKKNPTVKQRPRKCFASSIWGVMHRLSFSLQRRRVGECRQREFLFSKFEKRSFLLQKLWTVRENSMSVWILFASLTWKGRGERVYSDGVSHKRRFILKKIEQYISSIYRYKSCVFETLLTR